MPGKSKKQKEKKLVSHRMHSQNLGHKTLTCNKRPGPKEIVNIERTMAFPSFDKQREAQPFYSSDQTMNVQF